MIGNFDFGPTYSTKHGKVYRPVCDGIPVPQDISPKVWDISPEGWDFSPEGILSCGTKNLFGRIAFFHGWISR